MVDRKISELPAATDLTDAEAVVVVQGGQTRQATGLQARKLAASGLQDNEIPMRASDGTLAGSGMSRDPTTGDFVTERSIMVGSGSLIVGTNNINNSVSYIGGRVADGTRVSFPQVPHTTQGGARTQRPKFGAETFLPICTAQDQVISLATPINLEYVTVGQNSTEDFEVIPNEAGDFRAVFRLDSFTGRVIFDETRAFSSGEIGSTQRFGLGNAHAVPAGTSLFITLSGIDLRGGAAVSGDAVPAGTIFPYSRSVIHAYDLVNMADVDDITNAFDHADHTGNITTTETIDPATGNPKVVINNAGVAFQDDAVTVATSGTVNFIGDGVTASNVGGVPTFNIPGGTAPPAPQNIFNVFSQADTTVTQAIIDAVTDEGTALPYRYILPTPLQQYLVVAWHSTTEVSDIHVNILDAGETTANIVTSPLGNRFLRSDVQTAGIYEYQVLDISGDISLLTAGQSIGIYVG